MKFKIRNAELHDCESILELTNQLGYKSTYKEIKNRLEKLLGNVDNCVFVAVENGKTIGWIHGFYSLHVESRPFVEIGGLVVDEHSRTKGVGKTLVEHVEKWSKSINCFQIRVRSNTKRMESHKFYERIGFNKSKEQKIFDKLMK